MSMLKYPLYDFAATVPSCVETTTLASVLEIFEQEQCDRLMVLNQQQCPVGVLYSARFVSTLLTVEGNLNSNCIELQQFVAMQDEELLQPVQTLPASFCVEQFSSFLRSQQTQTNINSDWALIDTDGKFVGLVDGCRLLQFVAVQKLGISSKGDLCHSALDEAVHQSSSVEDSNKSRQPEHKLQIDKPLLQLLERLPWPLMLQTSTGEVVTQNPAWWQQLGTLKDPDGVRQQVEAILATVPAKKLQQSTSKTVKLHSRSKGHQHEREDVLNPIKSYSQDHSLQENSLLVLSETPPQNGRTRRSKSASSKNHKEQHSPETPVTSSRCFLDSQPGTCTCVVEVQNGQERIWQFAKIPLDSTELKILTPESETVASQIGHRTTTDSLLNGQLPQIREAFHQSSTEKNLWLMLATDVTEQQQLCKELAAKNADLIQLNRLKDEFLACISHELKTPLTAVLGLSRLLVDQQLGKLNERQARYAGLIHQSGRHLMSVVNDILDLTRMETGQMELTLSEVKIPAVCDRAISEARTIHRESSKATHANQTQTSPQEHQLTISIEPGLDEIVADELRLRQMLVHLLSNAFKFTETGGKIGLWVNRWEGWITFTIWDTGIGIPEHQQHLIFQKFQQLENPLTRQHEGTGLGLVLTRALARLHGGDVSFLSREGKGSQFTLLLPPSPPHKRAGEIGVWGKQDNEQNRGCFVGVPHNNLLNRGAVRPQKWQSDATCFKMKHSSGESHSTYPGNFNLGLSCDESVYKQQDQDVSVLQTHGNSLVLVVEAVARYIEDLTEQLTGLGYRVVIARSGCEALEKARRLQPKAIFLNPLIPLLSGWDVLTLLKSDTATRHIPVIVTATRAEKKQANANRADGFLSLPIQHQILAPLLENLCTTPEIQQQKSDGSQTISTKTPLRILRLVNSEWEYPCEHLSLHNQRVVEVDDLEQAELLARVWHFDVVLLDAQIADAKTYLQKLSQCPRLGILPLVTCDVETTQAASHISGLSVFPCLLAPFDNDPKSGNKKIDALLSVLQIAAGICCPPNILVVDFTMLPDLPAVRHQSMGNSSSAKNSLPNGRFIDEVNSLELKPLTISRGSEWFQALIQYLQTAGLKAVMGRSWAELLQQIRHKSVDLLLICLGESTIPQQVYSALQALTQLPFDLPPILVLDQKLNSPEIENTQPNISQDQTDEKNHLVESEESVVSAIANKILPRSISMEELLNQINQALKMY
jgi:signal transduction histidine kinase/DNA-binding response OmpR family regulator